MSSTKTQCCYTGGLGRTVSFLIKLREFFVADEVFDHYKTLKFELYNN